MNFFTRSQRHLAQWWARQDLNLRPHAYQACALTNWATGPFIKGGLKWWRLPGSNRWHSACKADALPTELNPRCDDSLNFVLNNDLVLLSRSENWIGRCVCFRYNTRNFWFGELLSYPQSWMNFMFNFRRRPILLNSIFSIERRWSSRRFPYGYLVTTSSQLPTTP